MNQSTALQIHNHSIALQDQMTLADAFVKSGLFKDISDSAQALVKIVKGQELGLQPMASMDAFYIIKGELMMASQCCAALVNACSYASYTPISHDEKHCTIRFQKLTREGWVNFPDVTYTIEIAIARGVMEKGKARDGREYDKSPEWKADPKNMLYWRAMQRGVRYYFPELMAGLTADIGYPAVTDDKFNEIKADLFGDDPAVAPEPAAPLAEQHIADLYGEETRTTVPRIPTEMHRDAPSLPAEPAQGNSDAEKRARLFEGIAAACKNKELETWAVYALCSRQLQKAVPDFTTTDLMALHVNLVSEPITDAYRHALADIEAERQANQESAQEEATA